MTRPRRPPEEEILIWSGVVAQLVRTRNNRILADSELPYPQFVMLRHFCHDPDREWTVSQLADAFETPQPGVSKTVRKLVERRLLRERSDALDARRNWLHVTPKGVRVRNDAVSRLAPDQRGVFAAWPRRDVAELRRLLLRLKTQLDESREEVLGG